VRYQGVQHTLIITAEVKHWVQGRSQKFILGGYNFLLHDTTVLYILAAWRHRLQLVHKIISRDWFWEGIYTDIPPPRRYAPDWVYILQNLYLCIGSLHVNHAEYTNRVTAVYCDACDASNPA